MKQVTIGHAASGAVTVDPERLISTRMLVQANSGGGKSWMLRVLCERLGRSVPLIVLDWEGEFASLREKLDVLLVGREGEIPTAVATAGVLATQRLSKLAKDAAAELNNVLIGRCTLDVDQKRACDILGFGREGRTVLRDLNAGEFQAFGPAFNFKGVSTIKSVDVETTHGAKAGASAKPPEPSARMQKAVEQLKGLAERAKTEVLDLDSARATIKELRKQLAKPAPVNTEQADAIRAERDDLARRVKDLLAAVQDRELRLNKICGLASSQKPVDVAPVVVRKIVAAIPKAVPRPVAPAASEPVEGLNGRHAQVLTAIRLCHAMGYDQPTREQVSFWSQKRGGNFNNLLGALRSANQIEYTTPGTVRALTDGEVPDRDEAYRSAINAISPRLRGVLDAILAAGGPTSREAISEATGKSGGNFNNLLGALRTAGLIVYTQPGMVDAADWLKECTNA